MCHFDGLQDAAQLDLLMAPIKLAGVTWQNQQGYEGFGGLGPYRVDFQRLTKRCTLSQAPPSQISCEPSNSRCAVRRSGRGSLASSSSYFVSGCSH